MMLAYTNPVVFKTTLKEGRGEDSTYSVVCEVLLKTIEKYWRVLNLSQVVLSEVVATKSWGLLSNCLPSFIIVIE